eukprot:Gregarina_sp_Poly_1__4345@NODE_2355_length_2247_cov_271_432110_g1501_i0_p2_GENE_NODE_2355_length_2247_cov_271_432110_g1501_i0NODE_2355_length_2247_cov_271_432110_g1501_i0_p2_ORF_typecomplete_len214_score10_38FAM150/PF15129_6/0_098_NODE_2355_length_2247_cov_271_432110_g1501_i016062151
MNVGNGVGKNDDANGKRDAHLTNPKDPLEERNPEYRKCYEGSSSVSNTVKSVSENYVASRTYFEIYRSNAYPTEGILAATPVPSFSLADHSEITTRKNEFKEMILSVLDSCLRFSPECRPTLMELGSKLHELRRDLIALEALHLGTDDWSNGHRAQPIWTSADSAFTTGRKSRTPVPGCRS